MYDDVVHDALVNHMKIVRIKIIGFLITNTVKYSFVKICVYVCVCADGAALREQKTYKL